MASNKCLKQQELGSAHALWCLHIPALNFRSLYMTPHIRIDLRLKQNEALPSKHCLVIHLLDMWAGTESFAFESCMKEGLTKINQENGFSTNLDTFPSSAKTFWPKWKPLLAVELQLQYSVSIVVTLVLSRWYPTLLKDKGHINFLQGKSLI